MAEKKYRIATADRNGKVTEMWKVKVMKKVMSLAEAAGIAMVEDEEGVTGTILKENIIRMEDGFFVADEANVSWCEKVSTTEDLIEEKNRMSDEEKEQLRKVLTEIKEELESDEDEPLPMPKLIPIDN